METPPVDEVLDRLVDISRRLNEAATDVPNALGGYAKVLEGIEEAVGEVITIRRQELDAGSTSSGILDAVEDLGIGSS